MVKNWSPLRWALLGLLAVMLMLYSFFGVGRNTVSFEEENQETMSSVVVAKRYIAPFTAIRSQDITIRSFPKAYVPPGAFHSIGDVEINDLPHYSSAVGIPEGQPLTSALVHEAGKNHGMASILSPGKVAVSFSADSVRSVGGWIQPGDSIAIFCTNRESDAKTSWRRQTHLVFSAVQVLAVDSKRLGHEGNETSKDDGSPAPEQSENVFTVVLNPLEAARLVEARETGRLSTLLRALGDDSPWVATPGMNHE